MKICDSHIHIGPLSDTQIVYPHDLKAFLSIHNIQECFFIPTARVDGGDNLILHSQLYEDAETTIGKPILYVNNTVLDRLRCGDRITNQKLYGIKIHPDAINISDDFLCDVCDIAYRMDLALLIHTSERQSSHSTRFEHYIQKFDKLKFILCHARPSNEAFSLLNNYRNVWIDTAFVPIDVLKANTTINNYKRILFGTDFPINRWYNINKSDDDWYDEQVKEIIETFPSKIAKSILHDNFINLFIESK